MVIQYPLRQFAGLDGAVYRRKEYFAALGQFLLAHQLFRPEVIPSVGDDKLQLITGIQVAQAGRIFCLGIQYGVRLFMLVCSVLWYLIRPRNDPILFPGSRYAD